jgi:hypothetical protein
MKQPAPSNPSRSERQWTMRDGCCLMMAHNLDAQKCPQHPDPFDCPDALLARMEDGKLGLIIHDGGRSVVQIKFCPWCGAVTP